MSDDKIKSQTTPESVDTDAAKTEFAQKLRGARERAGYSVEQLAYATKIMAQFIVCLEAGDFENVPGEVFVRGFVKSICKVLNEDSVELLALANKGYGVKKEKLLVVPGSPGASRVRIGSERPERKLNLDFLKDFKPLVMNKQFGMGVAGLAGIVLVGLLLYGLSALIKNSGGNVGDLASKHDPVEIKIAAEPPPETPEATDVAEEATTVPPAEAGQAKKPDETHTNQADTAQSIKSAEAGTVATHYSAPGEQVLELKVKEAVNIRINIDKRGWENARYEPDTYTIKFVDDVNLLVFDAAAVDINFNGKSLGSLGSKGRVRRLSFVKEGPVLENKEKM